MKTATNTRYTFDIPVPHGCMRSVIHAEEVEEFAIRYGNYFWERFVRLMDNLQLSFFQIEARVHHLLKKCEKRWWNQVCAEKYGFTN